MKLRKQFSPMTSQPDQETLALFKKSLSEHAIYNESPTPTDYLLFRFLRARKCDIPQATTMYINYLQWRKEANVDGIVHDFDFKEFKQVRELYPQFYHKVDKEGRPIYIERLGSLDVSKLLAITSIERMINKHIREYEKFVNYRLKACSIAANKNIENGFTILDLKGVPLSQFNSVRKLIQQLTAISSNYYPETLGKMFVINAPTLFTAVWSILKTMIDEHTVSKIHILGSKFEKQLLEHVYAKNLPDFLGGEAKEPPGGWVESDVGPWNDGSVPNFPDQFYECFKQRDMGIVTDSKGYLLFKLEPELMHWQYSFLSLK